MGLANIVRKGVALANKITDDLQDQVMIEAWVGNDVDGGAPIYSDTPVILKAVVEEGSAPRRLETGEVIIVKGSAMFVKQIPPNGSPDRREPIDPRDRITLPSGAVGVAVDVEVVNTDPASNSPYYTKVFVG